MYAVVIAVAAFAAIVSFSHIYDLGRLQGQSGTAARLLPLSVDGLIVAASLIMLISSRRTGGVHWLTRLMLWLGIGATVGANVAYGIPYGPLGAIVSAWPALAFVGAVEMVMVAVRPGGREADKRTLIVAGQPAVPSSSYEAAATAFAASVAGGHPLTEYQLAKRYTIPRSQARKICAPAAPEPSLNGSGPHA
jgi:hypothetical protein